MADIQNSYNGSSDLQLERMNVYFNEVRGREPHSSAHRT
jgi:hypothetical protein